MAAVARIGFLLRCGQCGQQKVHILNEFDSEQAVDYSGETTVTGGLYCPMCDLALCSECPPNRPCHLRADCPIRPPV